MPASIGNIRVHPRFFPIFMPRGAPHGTNLLWKSVGICEIWGSLSALKRPIRSSKRPSHLISDSLD